MKRIDAFDRAMRFARSEDATEREEIETKAATAASLLRQCEEKREKIRQSLNQLDELETGGVMELLHLKGTRPSATIQYEHRHYLATRRKIEA